MMEDTKTNYIYGDNLVLEQPPFYQKGTSMHGFLVQGDISAMQQVVDKHFNNVWKGDDTENHNKNKEFKVISSYIILTFVKTKYSSSLSEKDKKIGFEEETEVIPWILVRKKTASILPELFFYPYLALVNTAVALISGREFQGYPKYIGHAMIPDSMDDNEALSVTVHTYKNFLPETQLAPNELITVTPNKTAASEKPSGHNEKSDFTSLLKRLLHLIGEIDTDPMFNKALFQQTTQSLIPNIVNQLFLKQTPATDGVHAVYQAIISAPAIVQKVDRYLCANNPYIMTVAEDDSFPLANSLGLKVNQQGEINIKTSFFLDFDFIVEGGKELFVSGQCSPLLEKERIDD